MLEIPSDGGQVGRETRRRLVEWWSREYCSSRMCLAVLDRGEPRHLMRIAVVVNCLHPGSLDDLTTLAVKLFSPIQHRAQDPRPMMSDHPFSPEVMGVSCLIIIARFASLI